MNIHLQYLKKKSLFGQKEAEFLTAHVILDT